MVLMENDLPRAQSLTRQKWDRARQKWELALGKSTRSGTIFSRRLTANDGMRSCVSGELSNSGRPITFLSGELALVRPRSPVLRSKVSVPTKTAMRDAATNTDQEYSPMDAFFMDRRPLLRCRSLRSTSAREKKMREEAKGSELRAPLPKLETGIEDVVECLSGALPRRPSLVASSNTSIQTEKESSHDRLLSRGGESSSFRGKQLSSSLRRDSLSFQNETVSSSFRKEAGPRRKARKATKSLQNGEVPSVASESARERPCSNYHQAPFPATSPLPPRMATRSSSSSSADLDFAKSSVPLQWKEVPGVVKTIAAAAEMALARKLARDQALSRQHSAPARSNGDGHRSFKLVDKKPFQASSTDLLNDLTVLLPPPPAKKGSEELSLPRKDLHSSRLIEELKAAVVRKQSEHRASKLKVEIEDDSCSMTSEYGAREQAQIDLVAPAAAKILNREEDLLVLTPSRTPLVAVPFKWEEAPGKPKDCASSLPQDGPPLLSLPPRLLVGCRNPSKEQQAKILQGYSGSLIDMHSTASGNPTPLSHSRDATPTRRERTPTRNQNRMRDLTPGKRDVVYDSVPRRNNSSRVSKSGPVTVPIVPSQENIREHLSGPLRSNTCPNYLNVAPRSLSQEIERVAQESALMVLTQELESTLRPLSEPGSELLRGHTRGHTEELQMARCGSASRNSRNRSVLTVEGGDGSFELDIDSTVESQAFLKISSTFDPLSPTSILCGPDVSSSQRSTSNLSSVYAESSHSYHQESISDHRRTESSTSLESFIDESYNPPPWIGSFMMESSPFRDLGPVNMPLEAIHRNKLMECLKAVVKFCKRLHKSNIASKRNSAEPDMWAPTFSIYYDKFEIDGTYLNDFASEALPEATSISQSGDLNWSRSAPNFVPRSGELAKPDQTLEAKGSLGGTTSVHVITTSRSGMAAEECISVTFSLGRAWGGTKARRTKWVRKMRRSSRFIVAIFGALKRSISLKCGTHTLPNLPSDRNILDYDLGHVLHLNPSSNDAVHFLSANHQFHSPL